MNMMPEASIAKWAGRSDRATASMAQACASPAAWKRLAEYPADIAFSADARADSAVTGRHRFVRPSEGAALEEMAMANTVNDMLSDEHKLFQESVKRFIAEEMNPKFLEWEKADIGHPRELWKAAGMMGLVGLMIPEEFGGPACDPLYPILLAEEVAASPCGASLGGATFGADLLTLLMVEFGTDEQKRAYCPGILSGDIVQSIGISEPGAGSDVNAIATRARSDGDNFLISGQKIFISNGMQADLCYLVAKTDKDIEAGRGALTMFVVDLNADGVSRRRMEAIGMKASSIAELFFDEVRVPKSAILGREGGGLGANIAHFMLFDRVLMSLRAISTSRYALDLTIDYVKNRTVFNRRVIDFQNTQFKLAELKAELIVASALRTELITRFLSGTLDQVTASAAKLWTSELEYRVADECLQLHGGYGYMSETPISKIFTFARVERIYGGTNEIQKGSIARTL